MRRPTPLVSSVLLKRRGREVEEKEVEGEKWREKRRGRKRDREGKEVEKKRRVRECKGNRAGARWNKKTRRTPKS
ncbi:hypothetical protein [Natronomonas pharaonis]|uniref:hypothetical protein n=1 Tax=Natronomonas pharaonis TaxID=2257 RepID=UPI0011D17802|nr:hypothetical protein [Natronomonas pharaonis]